jgi:hypothetical protein
MNGIRHRLPGAAASALMLSALLAPVHARAQSGGVSSAAVPVSSPGERLTGGIDSVAHVDDTLERAATVPQDDPSHPLDSLSEPEPPRLLVSEFMYAGHPRYTLTGKPPYRDTHVSGATLGTFGGALLGLAVGITWYQQAWYPDSTKSSFHFQTDWGYSKQFDKAGHMYGGWMASYCGYEAFIASGFDTEDAALLGSIGGLFFQTFMEVQDGFFSYGFDPTDAVSNLIGAGYFYAQHKVPMLQYFAPKWSYGSNPRDSAREAAQIRQRIIVDDYDRQDVWLSAKVHYLLPEGLRDYWPKWLTLAVGAGARDVELIGYVPHRTLHIALDYDLVEIFPDMGTFGNWLIQSLNGFKLPAPALQVWPDVKFKLLYPITL